MKIPVDTLAQFAGISTDIPASPEKVGVLGLESVLIAAVLFFFVAGVAAYVYKQNKDRWNSFWKFLEHHLTHLFILVCMLGFVVYLVGMSISTGEGSVMLDVARLVCQAPMAFVHSFEMFLMQSDVSAIHDEFYNSLLFMSFFSLAHFLAAMVSMMFIMKYFGYNLVAKSRLMYAAHFKGHIDELYVFWGMNEASYCLAGDIRRKYSEGEKAGSYQIIIINTAGGDSEEIKKEHTALGRLLSFISFNSEEINRYQELGCLTANVFSKLSDVKVDDGGLPRDILSDQVDAVSLTKLMKKTDRKVHFFLFGADDDENVACTVALCADRSVVTRSEEGCKVIIYCHARYNGINRIMEDKYSTPDIEVKVVDSSHESINILKSRKEFQPVNFVEIDTEDNYGTVKSGFTSMVIGFGETGRDAVRFLYEYGSFVSDSSAREDDAPGLSKEEACRHTVERAPFRCYVVDKNADGLSGQFSACAPAVSGIEYWDKDICSSGFYEDIKLLCNDLNYVVIALGDDELNITTAVRLFRYIRKNRKDLSRFRLFVRCHNSDRKRHLQNIADHYNQNVKESGIIIFGTEDQLYTYSNVIENGFMEEGRRYNALYCEASGAHGERQLWDSRHRILLAEKTLDSFSELHRKESQDVANAFHALTKLSVIRKVSEDERGNVRQSFRHIHECLEHTRPAPQFTERMQDENGKRSGKVSVVGDDFTREEQLLFLNLARLEHLRWNAAHEVMGYRSFSSADQECLLVEDNGNSRHRCNETFKLHNCLVGWHELDAEMNADANAHHPDYKLYDYLVITATLMTGCK